ncbi:5-methylcytosine restriction system specificity protein McrC [Candidatus Avelusimicrobium fimicolum]|uniref:5-methylcytosine restriction system specificity protein McrC n=1 Tax=Candidatus Avelusimicrobium fimicolum TaxID=3416216 RepID=UPI003D1138FA
MYIYKISCSISAKDSTPKSILRCFCNIAHTDSLHNHTFTSWAILFDMNKLFEEFVPLVLSKTFPGQVKIQNTHKKITPKNIPEVIFKNYSHDYFCSIA